LSVYKLGLKALESPYFKNMVIDYLLSRQFRKDIILIKDVEMSNRLRNAMKKNKIKSLNQLTFLKFSTVARMPGIGLVKIQELKEIMNQYDFQFDSHIEGLEVLMSG
jgi:DNA-directed RNA polymerase alpha subunit